MYDFDTIVDRRGTSCLKYDQAVNRGYSPDILPLWIADMDFPTAPPILEKLSETVRHYEVLNVLNRFKPDVYFSRHPGSTVWAVKQGYSAVYVADEYMAFGYEGTLRLIKAIKDAVTNRSFEKNLAKRSKLPYTDWWYQQNVDTFLKGEKKNG